MEKQLIKGEFTSNKVQFSFFLAWGLLCLVPGLMLFWLLFEGFDANALAIGAAAACLLLAALSFILAYDAYKLKNQELIVTDCRIYVKHNNMEVSLPIDNITAVSLHDGRKVTISDASGEIVCLSCVNGNEVYSVINELLKSK